MAHWWSLADASAATKPNIVFILTDDLDKATLDVRPAIMPNLLTLIGQKGATFSNAFYNVPLCGPSRATVLTGRYAQNTGVLNNEAPNGGFPAFHTKGAENSTIATWLLAAGYRTGLFGKYINKYPEGVASNYVPPGWTTWIALPNIHAVGYVTDYLAKQANEFIGAANSAGKPFFLVLSTLSPHAGTKPAPRHAALFPSATAPRTASFNEADISDKPPFLQVPLMTGSQIAANDAEYRNRLRSLQSVDEALLAIYRKVQSIGQLSQTYFVFTSDNGYHLGQHRLTGGKETTYDEDLRMPLLMSGPGIPAGLTVTQLVSNADLAPTFAAWAGVAPASTVDGRSLMPVLKTTPPTTWRRSLAIAHWNNGGFSKKRILQDFLGVRTPRYSYARYPALPGVLSIYDVTGDPAQLTNLARTMDATLRGQLDALTTSLASCSGATCVARENATAP
jgi:arylsulfatase A-like enzyme